MSNLKRIFYWLDEHLEETILIILILMIALLTGIQVFMRKVIGSPLTWSEELCRFSYIWTGFISVGYCFKKNTFIRISTFVILLPNVVQRILHILTYLVSLVMYGIFVRSTYRVVVFTKAGGELTASLNWPSYFIYVGALLGFSFSVIRVVQAIINEIQKMRDNSQNDPSNKQEKGSYLDKVGKIIDKE